MCVPNLACTVLLLVYDDKVGGVEDHPILSGSLECVY